MKMNSGLTNHVSLQCALDCFRDSVALVRNQFPEALFARDPSFPTYKILTGQDGWTPGTLAHTGTKLVKAEMFAICSRVPMGWQALSVPVRPKERGHKDLAEVARNRGLRLSSFQVGTYQLIGREYERASPVRISRIEGTLNQKFAGSCSERGTSTDFPCYLNYLDVDEYSDVAREILAGLRFDTSWQRPQHGGAP